VIGLSTIKNNDTIKASDFASASLSAYLTIEIVSIKAAEHL